jgi:hypothetical protein
MNENQAQQNQAQNQAVQNGATNQATNQNQQMAQQAAKAAEAKTVVNGQAVNVKEAQGAEAAFEKQNTRTGIQQHHDNTSEAVEAGQMAQNAADLLAQQTHYKAIVRQADLQSGQQHLEPHVQEAKQALQEIERQMVKQEEQRMQQMQQQQQGQGQQAAQQAQQSQAISQDQQTKIEDHEVIQNDLAAKAKAKANKKG